MTTMENRTTVLEMLDAALNRGDISVVERTVAGDHIEHETDGDEVGREHVAQGILAYRAAFPDLRMSFDDQICEGDRVVTRWTGTGTHLGNLNGVPPTGQVAEVWGVFIHRLAAGRITETWTSFDQLDLLKQLRVIPPPTAGGSTPVKHAPTAARQ